MTVRRRIFDALAPKPNTLPRLDGPVFLLGSAPNPTPFFDASGEWSLITVNGSQSIAAPWGMTPTLTLFGMTFIQTTKANLEARKVLVGARTRYLLCIGSPRHYFRYKYIMWRLGFNSEHMSILTPGERERITSEIIGMPKSVSGKASNGVFLALLCLYLGASKVVMGGFSLTKQGHAYNTKGFFRHHIDADTAVLAAAENLGLPIYTNDASFAAESGLPLLEG